MLVSIQLKMFYTALYYAGGTKKRHSFPSLSFELLYSASGTDNLQDKEMCPVDEASGEKNHISWVILSDLEARGSFLSKYKKT